MWIPSWTDVTCIFKELLRHVSHWKGLFPSWTEATCFFFKSPFREHLWSQMSHFNSFFPSCTNATWYSRYPLLYSFDHKCYIWMASFLHELKQCAVSCCQLLWNFYGKFHIWISFFLLALMWHVFSRSPFRNSFWYISHIQRAFFFMEWNNMFFQIIFLRTSVIANVTFEFFFSLSRTKVLHEYARYPLLNSFGHKCYT